MPAVSPGRIFRLSRKTGENPVKNPVSANGKCYQRAEQDCLIHIVKGWGRDDLIDILLSLMTGVAQPRPRS